MNSSSSGPVMMPASSTSPSPSMGVKRARLIDINEWITCYLCGGYLIDATTLIECQTLHSFCRSCICKYLKETSGSSPVCPTCDEPLNESKPHISMRLDTKLQDIVYKLVPGLYKKEMERRAAFYAASGQKDPKAVSNSNVSRSLFYVPEDKISLSLEYHFQEDEHSKSADNDGKRKANEMLSGNGGDSKTDLLDHESDLKGSSNGDLSPLNNDRRYLLCQAGMPVYLLKKFIVQKYSLDTSYQVNLMYQNHVLTDDLTLMDVIYIYSWCSNDPMRFYYTIEKSNKKLKSVSVETSVTSSQEQEKETPAVKRAKKEPPRPIASLPLLDTSPSSSAANKKHHHHHKKKEKSPKSPKSPKPTFHAVPTSRGVTIKKDVVGLVSPTLKIPRPQSSPSSSSPTTATNPVTSPSLTSPTPGASVSPASQTKVSPSSSSAKDVPSPHRAASPLPLFEKPPRPSLSHTSSRSSPAPPNRPLASRQSPSVTPQSHVSKVASNVPPTKSSPQLGTNSSAPIRSTHRICDIIGEESSSSSASSSKSSAVAKITSASSSSLNTSKMNQSSSYTIPKVTPACPSKPSITSGKPGPAFGSRSSLTSSSSPSLGTSRPHGNNSSCTSRPLPPKAGCESTKSIGPSGTLRPVSKPAPLSVKTAAAQAAAAAMAGSPFPRRTFPQSKFSSSSSAPSPMRLPFGSSSRSPYDVPSVANRGRMATPSPQMPAKSKTSSFRASNESSSSSFAGSGNLSKTSSSSSSSLGASSSLHVPRGNMNMSDSSSSLVSKSPFPKLPVNYGSGSTFPSLQMSSSSSGSSLANLRASSPMFSPPGIPRTVSATSSSVESLASVTAGLGSPLTLPFMSGTNSGSNSFSSSRNLPGHFSSSSPPGIKSSLSPSSMSSFSPCANKASLVAPPNNVSSAAASSVPVSRHVPLFHSFPIRPSVTRPALGTKVTSSRDGRSLDTILGARLPHFKEVVNGQETVADNDKTSANTSSKSGLSPPIRLGSASPPNTNSGSKVPNVTSEPSSAATTTISRVTIKNNNNNCIKSDLKSKLSSSTISPNGSGNSSSSCGSITTNSCQVSPSSYLASPPPTPGDSSPNKDTIVSSPNHVSTALDLTIKID